jgi:hypothetical protein
MRWAMWCWGLLAGFALGSYVTLSCGPTQAQSEEVAGAIHEAAVTYGVPEGRLRCLAWRESRFWAGAYNAAGYHGLYQFDWPTWRYGSRLAGLTDATPYDPWSAAHVTALLIARGEGSRWPPLRWC